MKRIVLVLAGLAFIAPLVLAQPCKISGTVTDKNTGEPLIGANVIIVGTDKGSATNIKGEWVLPECTPGTYTLKATYIGFQKQDTTFVITENSILHITFALDEAVIYHDSHHPHDARSYDMPLDTTPGWHRGMNSADGIMYMFGMGDPDAYIPYGGRGHVYM